MIDFKRIMTSETNKVRCYKCGKEIEIPNMMRETIRQSVLSPFCCSNSVFTVQWLVHHGWHVRNLGLTDSHPYFCPDCWENREPEYVARDYGKQWCEQAQAWVESNN